MDWRLNAKTYLINMRGCKKEMREGGGEGGREGEREREKKG